MAAYKSPRVGVQGPKPPKSALSAVQADTRDANAFQRDAWMRSVKVLININDSRLSPHERRLVEGIGTKLYGPRA
ncbi:MAG: hypothetical protein AB7I36_08340 [Rhodospirillaceae bacterium]